MQKIKMPPNRIFIFYVVMYLNVININIIPLANI